MAIVAGIRFKPAGKVYYFDPGELDLPVHTGVIVETARGIEYGTVVVAPRDVPDDDVVQPLKQVIRCATSDDEARLQQLTERNGEAMQVARERIIAHGLAMHLVEVESTFDGSKMIFQFTAEQRIDFRELVRDLAGRFRTRIELRQIGVRDEAKLLGGIGMCGRELCCSTWMTEFMPVSIRMAKDQNLSLNPAKISGVCGRLLCCLRFELDPDARGKSHQQLAAEPSLQEMELAQALQEDMLAAVESAPTDEVDRPFQAVSMPARREAPRRPQSAASDADEATVVRPPSALRPPQPARAAPAEKPDVPDNPMPEPAGDTGNGQGRNRRRRRGRSPRSTVQAASPGTAGPDPSAAAKAPRAQRHRRRPRRPGGSGAPGGTPGQPPA